MTQALRVAWLTWDFQSKKKPAQGGLFFSRIAAIIE
jgi:hypothetical protein